jgi:CBS domain-containing protein
VDFEKALKNEKIRNLSTSEVVVVGPDDTLGTVIRRLQEVKAGCAVIVEENKVVGIFTERDALKRAALTKRPATTPIRDLMTPRPKVLNWEDSVAVAIRFMNEGRYRHLPIVNERGEFAGLFSVRDIVLYLSELYPSDIYNLPPDPHQVARAREGA